MLKGTYLQLEVSLKIKFVFYADFRERFEDCKSNTGVISYDIQCVVVR